MRSLRHIARVCWRCGCLACHCLNFLLFFLAFAQAGLVGLNFLQREVPVPDKLARWIFNELGPANLSADWKKAVFDLRAGLVLDGFVLSQASSDQVIATAAQARVQWAPLHLLFPGITPIREIEGRSVEIYIPASRSPSGLNEPVLSLLQVALREDKGRLVVPSLMLQTGAIHLHLSGSAPLELLRGGTVAKPAFDWIGLLQTLRRLPQDIEAWARVDWQMLPTGSHAFDIDWILPALDLEMASLRGLHGRAKVSIVGSQPMLRQLRADGLLTRADLPRQLDLVEPASAGQPIPVHLASWGPAHKVDRFILPSEWTLSLKVKGRLLPLDRLILNTSLIDRPQGLHWILSDPSFFAAGFLAAPAGIPALLDRSTDAPSAIPFRACLQQAEAARFIPGPPPHRLLKGARADRIGITGAFNLPARSLDAALFIDGLSIGQTPIHSIAATFNLDPAGVSFPAIHISRNATESAQGSYCHHFASSRFSLNASGAIFPASLDSILGTWWPDIFVDIQPREIVSADVTVWGYWDDEASLQSVSGIRAGNFLYAGALVPELDLRVRSNYDWALLERLEGRFGEGRISGTVAIRSGLGPEVRYRPLLLDISSTADWDTVRALSGIGQLEVLAFTAGNPQLKAKGVVWRPHGETVARPGLEAALELELSQPDGICTVQGLRLQGLRFSGEVAGRRLRLQPLSGSFAGGVFTGSMRLDNWQAEGSPLRSYDLELFDADFGDALQQLTGLMEKPEAIRGTLVRDAQKGRLDAQVVLTTGGPEVPSSGNGKIWLRQAAIGRIHLLGGLSRFLDSMGLGFSSLDLDTLSLDWDLNGDKLDIRNGLVTGPILKLTLEGSVDLARNELAMQADVTLFQGVISKVLAPMSENLQFDLTGPLENPNWKIRFRPFRWFLGG